MAEPGRPPPAAPPEPSTEGLPRAFLQSLRTLFDILDDRRRGYVHLREIESRWQGADARELPCGVLEGLRQVAPASGYLTFERFVAGLRTSLLSADGGPRGSARAPARGGGPARPGGQQQPPPPPPQRLVFAPADEPRTVLERKPLPLCARPPAADPGGTARSLEKLCDPAAEAAPGLAEPERPQGAALERSPSADAGECGAARLLAPQPGPHLRREPEKGGLCIAHRGRGRGRAALPGLLSLEGKEASYLSVCFPYHSVRLPGPRGWWVTPQTPPGTRSVPNMRWALGTPSGCEGALHLYTWGHLGRGFIPGLQVGRPWPRRRRFLLMRTRGSPGPRRGPFCLLGSVSV